jgi:hypothetical protein
MGSSPDRPPVSAMGDRASQRYAMPRRAYCFDPPDRSKREASRNPVAALARLLFCSYPEDQSNMQSAAWHGVTLRGATGFREVLRSMAWRCEALQGSARRCVALPRAARRCVEWRGAARRYRVSRGAAWHGVALPFMDRPQVLPTNSTRPKTPERHPKDTLGPCAEQEPYSALSGVSGALCLWSFPSGRFLRDLLGT